MGCSPPVRLFCFLAGVFCFDLDLMLANPRQYPENNNPCPFLGRFAWTCIIRPLLFFLTLFRWKSCLSILVVGVLSHAVRGGRESFLMQVWTGIYLLYLVQDKREESTWYGGRAFSGFFSGWLAWCDFESCRKPKI